MMKCAICNGTWLGTGNPYTIICKFCFDAAMSSVRFMNSQLPPSLNFKTLASLPEFMNALKEKEDEQNKRVEFLTGFVAHYNDQLPSDIQLKPANNGPPVPAHRALLASRSEIFKNMFDSDGCMAAPSDTITLPELNHEQLESLVEFLYSGSLSTEKLEKHVYSLFLAAHKYEIQYLQEVCGRYMLRSLSTSNVFDVLEIAYVCSDNKTLKEAASNLIVKNMEDIVYSAEYEAFSLKNPQLCLQVTKQFFKKAKH